MTVSLHSEITYNKADDPTTDKEGNSGYNDKVVHADVTFNEYTKPGSGAGSIDPGTLEELQTLVANAKNAANTAVAASEDAALSRDASQANADSASTSATNAQNDADRAEEAALRAEEAAERAEQAGSGGGSSSGGTLDEETLQMINDLVDEAKTAATNASGSADSAAESASNAKTSEVNAGAGINLDEVDMEQVYAYLNANVEYVNDTMDNKIEAALTLLNAKVDQRLAELEARIAALENKNN